MKYSGVFINKVAICVSVGNDSCTVYPNGSVLHPVALADENYTISGMVMVPGRNAIITKNEKEAG